MRRMSIVTVAVCFCAAALLAHVGCGVFGGRTVDSPDEESPEWVVQQAIIAAMDTDANKGFARFKSMLHSMQKNAGSLQVYKSMKFPTMRRKVKLYLEDDTQPIYKIEKTEEPNDDELKIFLKNEGNPEHPTPCILKKDPKQGGKWRIQNCSL